MLVICPNCSESFAHREAKEYTENTILVEGADDEMLIHSLKKARGLTLSRLTIEAGNGYPSILQRIKSIRLNSGHVKLKKLLLIADANSIGAEGRFRDIIQHLSKDEFTIPGSLGVLSSSELGKIQCGVYLFPDNKSKGTIEDLCLKALNHPDKIPCINDHIECIRNMSLLETDQNDLSKSKFHIYMSTGSKPTGSIGGATQVHELNLKSSVFDGLVNFLHSTS
jgi:hypothetical protein